MKKKDATFCWDILKLSGSNISPQMRQKEAVKQITPKKGQANPICWNKKSW